MDCFAGLDVSIDETAICIVDEAGKTLMTASVATDPEAIAEALEPYRKQLCRAGHEAGALAPWLHPARPNGASRSFAWRPGMCARR